jgi:COP9 signalosome complex subunit 5
MDHLYAFPDDKIEQVRKTKSWCSDPKYFKKVKVSPSATIKMLAHGQQGVEKGTSKSGKPLEVMGLLLGRPDCDDVNSIIISDALPLPIEGFETRVVADDDNVMNYMIELGESMELTRKEKFCGWYHTHPFDLDGTNHCYLSNTDVTTQLHWQRTEDPHGNPWLAIVIDPLLSLANAKPEMLAFRVYPPEYSANANETPDGKIITNDQIRIAHWGACWNRYYNIPIEYFMSNLTKESLEKMSNKFLWQRALLNSSKSKGDDGADGKDIALLSNLGNKLEKIQSGKRKGGIGGFGDLDEVINGPSATSMQRSTEVVPELEEAELAATAGSSVTLDRGAESSSSGLKSVKQVAQIGTDLSKDHVCTICNLLVKKLIFCSNSIHKIASTDPFGYNCAAAVDHTKMEG